MKEGSIVKHVKFGSGVIKHMSDEKIIVDFGKFDIHFLPSQTSELTEV
jgi:predicted ester cyclase